MQDFFREKTFPSGDKLIFEKSDGMYAEYGYLFYLQVYYAEKIDDSYHVTQIEYFPITEFAKAEDCYNQRAKSEHPSRGSGMGVSLADIATYNLRYLSKDMAEVHEVTPIPPESNSFMWDRIRKGVTLEPNLTVMYREPDAKGQLPDHLVLVNNQTGRRLFVNLSGFDQTIEDRIKEVNENTKPTGVLATLADLRDYLNRLPIDELKHPVIVGSADGKSFQKVSRIMMTDLKNPLIKDQEVLIVS